MYSDQGVQHVYKSHVTASDGKMNLRIRARATYHDLTRAIPEKKKEVEIEKREEGKAQERGYLRDKKTEERAIFQRTNPFYLQKLFWSSFVPVSETCYLLQLFWN